MRTSARRSLRLTPGPFVGRRLAAVAMIMVRTLRRDLAEYNSIEEKEELLEESGWKLVHADVLRTPPNVTLLATSVGTGMQLLGMGFISIACAALGFLSPANRGSSACTALNPRSALWVGLKTAQRATAVSRRQC
jgi:hypothetical protein